MVNREVEIRPLRGGEAGQATDILVEAVVPIKRSGPFEAVQVIIETKGCWNSGLDTAMQSQLVERYLADNQCQHGLYLVGYFYCQSWDDRDYRKKQSVKGDVDAIVQKFEAQAKTLSRSGRTIASRILDLRF